MIMNCKCGSKYIVNKLYNLCNSCNNIRLHGKKFKTYNKPKLKIKPNLKKQLKEEKLSENKSNKCEGCFCTNKHLDLSHIIPISLRKDLELEEKNTNLLCRDCHIIWEHKDWQEKSKLFCFESNLEYIKTVDIFYFNRIYDKLK